MMKVTFHTATCSVGVGCGRSDTEDFFAACEGAFKAEGSDFADHVAQWLCDNKDMVVLTQDEYDAALADARPEGEVFGAAEEKPKAAWSDADYHAGYNDGYNGDAIHCTSEAYMEGYMEGKGVLEDEDDSTDTEE